MPCWCKGTPTPASAQCRVLVLERCGWRRLIQCVTPCALRSLRGGGAQGFFGNAMWLGFAYVIFNAGYNIYSTSARRCCRPRPGGRRCLRALRSPTRQCALAARAVPRNTLDMQPRHWLPLLRRWRPDPLCPAVCLTPPAPTPAPRLPHVAQSCASRPSASRSHASGPCSTPTRTLTSTCACSVTCVRHGGQTNPRSRVLCRAHAPRTTSERQWDPLNLCSRDKARGIKITTPARRAIPRAHFFCCHDHDHDHGHGRGAWVGTHRPTRRLP